MGKQQTQNICITFAKRRTNVEHVGPTLYNFVIQMLCVYWDGHVCTNGLTASARSGLDTMMTLGGSPMAVAVPPMFENMTTARRTCLASSSNTSHNLYMKTSTMCIRSVCMGYYNSYYPC